MNKSQNGRRGFGLPMSQDGTQKFGLHEIKMVEAFGVHGIQKERQIFVLHEIQMIERLWCA